jgi:hypothetical protein
MTYLGQEAAYAAWRFTLFLGAAATVWPMVRRPSPAAVTLAILIFALLISNLPAANVTGLIVGALALTLGTRAGPVVVGLAASLKIFPILLVLGYVAERRWGSALVAMGVAATLWLHVLAFGLSTVPIEVGGSSFFLGGLSLFSVSPWVWSSAAHRGRGSWCRRRSRWWCRACGCPMPHT